MKLTTPTAPLGTLRMIRRRFPEATLLYSTKKYAAKLVTAAGRMSLTRSSLIGWQHIIKVRRSIYRVTIVRRGGRQRLVAISRGDFSDAAERAFSALVAIERPARRTVTVASLTIPSLLVQALWLRGNGFERFWILDPSHSHATRSCLLTRLQLIRSLSKVHRHVTWSNGERPGRRTH